MREAARRPHLIPGRTTRRKLARRVIWRSDPYLAFGLFLVPRPVARPITIQLEATRTPFVELSDVDAARVVEGLVFLQWIRAGLLALVGLGVAIATHKLGEPGRQVGLVVAITLVMWLPVYMILLSGVWYALRSDNEGDEEQRPVARRRRLLLFMRAAPILSLIIAWPLATLLG
jgi:hypothetical protein